MLFLIILLVLILLVAFSTLYDYRKTTSKRFLDPNIDAGIDSKVFALLKTIDLPIELHQKSAEMLTQ
jgi:hypothetical protein